MVMDLGGGFSRLAVGASRAPAAPRRQSFYETLLVTAWFGLFTGLIEVAIGTVRKFGFHQAIHVGRDFYWMAPLAGLIFFMITGLAVFAAARSLPWFDGLRLTLFVMALLSLLNLFFLFPWLHHYSALLLAIGGAAQVARMVSRRAVAFRRMVCRAVLWMLGAMALLAITAQTWPIAVERRALARLAPAPAQAPNVLLIILDTVRASNLSVYGYERATTPNLEKFGQSGVVFERALSTAPWTLPSHASMFTGRFPHELSANWDTPLDGAYPTLAERLSSHGYLTAGFVANTYYCSYELGLSRGFIHYEDHGISLGEIANSLTVVRTIADNFRLRRLVRNDEFLNRQSAEDVNHKFLSWLQGGHGRPFFAYLNYFDAHDPYLPPAPFDRKFGPGRKEGKKTALRHSETGPENDYLLPPADQQEEIDAYDGAIAYLDHQLGLLFDELRKRGLYDNTLIIVTSDHGEEFGEHGIYGHGNSLYLPSIHVPLLISFPGRAPSGQRVAEPVTLRDLPDTVAEIAGLRERFPGQTLTRYWTRPTFPERAGESPLLSSVRQVSGASERFPVSKGDMSSLVYNDHRFIRNGDGSEELYDFARDPWERNNLVTLAENRLALERLRFRWFHQARFEERLE